MAVRDGRLSPVQRPVNSLAWQGRVDGMMVRTRTSSQHPRDGGNIATGLAWHGAGRGRQQFMMSGAGWGSWMIATAMPETGHLQVPDRRKAGHADRAGRRGTASTNRPAFRQRVQFVQRHAACLPASPAGPRGGSLASGPDFPASSAGSQADRRAGGGAGSRQCVAVRSSTGSAGPASARAARGCARYPPSAPSAARRKAYGPALAPAARRSTRLGRKPASILPPPVGAMLALSPASAAQADADATASPARQTSRGNLRAAAHYPQRRQGGRPRPRACPQWIPPGDPRHAQHRTRAAARGTGQATKRATSTFNSRASARTAAKTFSRIVADETSSCCRLVPDAPRRSGRRRPATGTSASPSHGQR